MPRIPLFPLPLVLFPEVELPLHIFEPRYQQLLHDALADDRRFGILARRPGVGEREIAAGHVGCIAEVRHREPMPDGRSNVLVIGRERFTLEAFVDDDAPYHVGDVSEFADLAEPPSELATLAETVRELFKRVAGDARRIADDADPVPELPDDPALVAFRIASLVDLDLDARQALLASRSPGARLHTIRQLLEVVGPDVARRADVHTGAKTNGKGPH